MMKSTLAIVVSTLLLSSAVQAAEVYNKDGNKLDVYGRARGLHLFSDNTGKNGDASYARLGFKGQTKINDLMTGYGQWEYQFNLNNSEGPDSNSGNKTRLGFAGLKFGQYGSFDYGRNYGVLYDVEAWTDMLPNFGGDGTANTDNYMTARANGVATYRNSNFFGLVDGLKFALQYQGKNESTAPDGRALKTQNGDGFGLSSSYDLGKSGVSIGAAYTASDRTDVQTNAAYGKGSKAEAWATSVKYDANSVYLAAMYSETRNMTPFSGKAIVNNNTKAISVSGAANKVQNVELVAQYQFDFGLRPSLGYIQTKGKDLENGIGDADLVKYIDVGMTYYFNKNMNTYVDYKINQLGNNNKLGLNNDDIVAVGLTYQF